MRHAVGGLLVHGAERRRTLPRDVNVVARLVEQQRETADVRRAEADDVRLVAVVPRAIDHERVHDVPTERDPRTGLRPEPDLREVGEAMDVVAALVHHGSDREVGARAVAEVNAVVGVAPATVVEKPGPEPVADALARSSRPSTCRSRRCRAARRGRPPSRDRRSCRRDGPSPRPARCCRRSSGRCGSRPCPCPPSREAARRRRRRHRIDPRGRRSRPGPRSPVRRPRAIRSDRCPRRRGAAPHRTVPPPRPRCARGRRRRPLRPRGCPSRECRSPGHAKVPRTSSCRRPRRRRSRNRGFRTRRHRCRCVPRPRRAIRDVRPRRGRARARASDRARSIRPPWRTSRASAPREAGARAPAAIRSACDPCARG